MGPTVSAHRAAPELPIGAARPLAAYPIGLGRRLADFRVNDELRHAGVPVNDVENEGKGWLDADLVKRTCRLFVGPDDVTEVVVLGATRADGTRLSIVRGFYRGAHAEEIVADLAELTSCDSAYFRFNPLRPELLARGRLKPSVEVEAAADSDVTRQKWLVLTVDPVRRDRDGRERNAVASTDAELLAAFEAIDRITDNMARLGLPDPVLARSGNGAYGMWPIDLPADSELGLTVPDKRLLSLFRLHRRCLVTARLCVTLRCLGDLNGQIHREASRRAHGAADQPYQLGRDGDRCCRVARDNICEQPFLLRVCHQPTKAGRGSLAELGVWRRERAPHDVTRPVGEDQSECLVFTVAALNQVPVDGGEQVDGHGDCVPVARVTFGTCKALGQPARLGRKVKAQPPC